MNRIKIRVPALVTKIAAFVLIVATLSGCGAGQVSQTAAQEPAVNGNRLTINNVALRDIRLQAAQTSGFLQPGKAVDLVLVAANQSPDVPDRLVGISSDVGTARVTGDTRLPAGGMLFIGVPDGQDVTPGPLQANKVARATVTLTKPITNGLTYNFIFNFEKAGHGSVAVPISAGLAPQQKPAQHS